MKRLNAREYLKLPISFAAGFLLYMYLFFYNNIIRKSNDAVEWR